MTVSDDEPPRRSLFAERGSPMSQRELDRVNRTLAYDEAIEAFARGRHEGKGMVWVLTERRMLLVGTSWQGSTTVLPLEALRGLEAEEGVHGITLRLATDRGTHAVVAVDAGLADRLLAVVRTRGLAPVSWVSASARRPAAPPAVASRPDTPVAVAADVAARTALAERLVAALREADELRRRGALTDAEFARLKERILSS